MKIDDVVSTFSTLMVKVHLNMQLWPHQLRHYCPFFSLSLSTLLPHQPVFDPFFVSVYNMIYTAMPVLALGTFDKDVEERMSLKFARLYTPGQRNLFFTREKFAQSAIHGILTSLVLFGVTMGNDDGVTGTEIRSSRHNSSQLLTIPHSSSQFLTVPHCFRHSLLETLHATL